MAEIINMPQLSDTMKEGKVIKWHKKLGDYVKEGDILVEIETDKAIQEFESEFNGRLIYLGVKENETIEVNTILGIIGDLDEDINILINKNINNKSVKDKSTKIEIINMPKLSDTMTEGKISKWHKKLGDYVKEGDILVEIETDKAIQEFESEFNGTLLHIGLEEGKSASINSMLAIIGPVGSDISFIKSKSNFDNQNLLKKDSTLEKNRLFISPLAKKMSKNHEIDLFKIKGTGTNKRIIKRDIEKLIYLKSKIIDSSENELNNTVVKKSNIDFFTPNSQMRNIIATRLSKSKFSAPHYYLMIEVCMDEVIKSRKILNSSSEIKISFNDIIIKATAFSLKKHIQINSSWSKDKIIHNKNINIGVAVSIPDGLIVPVIKNTDYLSLSEISNLVKDLVSRSKNKSLKAKEIEGSTFSISNLGMFGVEIFTSIINQPNSCILSVGGIFQKPIIKNNIIVIGNVMKLSLACDHRVVDGTIGAQFLQTLKNFLENPINMLI